MNSFSGFMVNLIRLSANLSQRKRRRNYLFGNALVPA